MHGSVLYGWREGKEKKIMDAGVESQDRELHFGLLCAAFFRKRERGKEGGRLFALTSSWNGL